MPISSDFTFADPKAIIVARDDRQRKAPNTAGLMESIANYGVLNPIIVKRDLTLVAGERRLLSSLQLHMDSIPVRYIDELDLQELQIIELEENLKRSELPWRDEVMSIAKLHAAYVAQDSTWSQTKTARALSMDDGQLSRILRVARDINNPKIATAPGLSTAFNLLSRIDQRVADTAFSEILAATTDMVADAPDDTPSPQQGHVTAPGPMDLAIATGQAQRLHPNPATGHIEPTLYGAAQAQPKLAAQPSVDESILNTSFLSWAPTYSGPKFNLIHCDFPYGIDAFAGPKAVGSGYSVAEGTSIDDLNEARTYDDKAEVYWELLATFCTHMDNFMAHSAHVMFWLSMQHYAATLEFLRKHAPALDVNPYPLVWGKSDNRGVLADPKRGPRNIYEVCLIASREDRLILKSTSNAYWSPSDKTSHPSTKPEPMLRYFMGMFVDGTTSMLDPTCGGGSALRAAESLGARTTLGLELNSEHCDNARAALRKFRVMASI